MKDKFLGLFLHLSHAHENIRLGFCNDKVEVVKVAEIRLNNGLLGHLQALEGEATKRTSKEASHMWKQQLLQEPKNFKPTVEAEIL